MTKLTTILLGVSASLCLLGSTSQTTDAATTKLSKGYINVSPHHYYLTKAKILTTQGTSTKRFKVTIPKGTILQPGYTTTTKRGHSYLQVSVDGLNYSIRKPFLAHKSTVSYTAWIAAKSTFFKRVKRPTYLKYYPGNHIFPTGASRIARNDGNLWQGTQLPADYLSATANRIRVTTNGYLEHFSKSPFYYSISGKPDSTTKVQKALYFNKGHLNLYFKTKPKKIATTKFHKKGNYRYRLIINRLYQNAVTNISNGKNPADPLNVDYVMVSGKYTVANKDYYMTTESINLDN